MTAPPFGEPVINPPFFSILIHDRYAYHRMVYHVPDFRTLR